MRSFATALFVLLGLWSGAPGYGADRSVRGVVSDESNGVLPVVGDALVVAVQNDSATIRVDHVTDAIFVGNWPAPQRH